MFLVISAIAKSATEEPANLNIRFSQNIIKLSRKTLRPVIVSSTAIEPEPAPLEKSSSSKGLLKTISCGVPDIPA